MGSVAKSKILLFSSNKIFPFKKKNQKQKLVKALKG